MRRKKLFFIIPAAIVGLALFLFIGGEVVKLLWNCCCRRCSGSTRSLSGKRSASWRCAASCSATTAGADIAPAEIGFCNCMSERWAEHDARTARAYAGSLGLSLRLRTASGSNCAQRFATDNSAKRTAKTGLARDSSLVFARRYIGATPVVSAGSLRIFW